MTTTAKPRKRPATYADLEAVPPNLVAEILGGELVTRRPLRPRHALAKTSLAHELASEFRRRTERPNGWTFISQPELHLGGHVIVPGIAGWQRPFSSKQLDEVGVRVAPDWVCEVISRDAAEVDSPIRHGTYLDAGVQHLWFLDPDNKTLEVFKRGDDYWSLLKTFGGHEDVRAAPFDAISFSLGALWPYDPPAVAEGN